MTVPLVAATCFGGHLDKSRQFLSEYGYMKKRLSKATSTAACMPTGLGPTRALRAAPAELFNQHNSQRTYAVDSLPVPACDNIRIRRCRLLAPSPRPGQVK
jgi:hypothetical protein